MSRFEILRVHTVRNFFPKNFLRWAHCYRSYFMTHFLKHRCFKIQLAEGGKFDDGCFFS